MRGLGRPDNGKTERQPTTSPHMSRTLSPDCLCSANPSMPYSRAERKSVYIEWRRIFSSHENSVLRKQKAIMTVVRRHQPLSERFNPNLVGILQSLLTDGIIRSYDDSEARRSFPELFPSLPAATRKEATSNPVTTNMMSKTAHESESQKRLLCSLEQ